MFLVTSPTSSKCISWTLIGNKVLMYSLLQSIFISGYSDLSPCAAFGLQYHRIVENWVVIYPFVYLMELRLLFGEYFLVTLNIITCHWQLYSMILEISLALRKNMISSKNDKHMLAIFWAFSCFGKIISECASNLTFENTYNRQFWEDLKRCLLYVNAEELSVKSNPEKKAYCMWMQKN